MFVSTPFWIEPSPISRIKREIGEGRVGGTPPSVILDIFNRESSVFSLFFAVGVGRISVA